MKFVFAAALLLGGLRDPRLFAVGAAAVWAAVWAERPPLGLAAYWLPWLCWALFSACLSGQPLAALPVLARWATALAFASLAGAWTARTREDWLKVFLAAAAVLAGAAAFTGMPYGFAQEMKGLIPPYYNYTMFALSAAAAAALAWLLHPRGPRGRWGAAAAAIAGLCLACLYLSRSRGAFLGLGTAGVIWALRQRRAVGLLVAVAAIGAFSLKAGRLRGEARPGIWRASAAIATEAPWFGEGPGNFAVGFRRHPVPTPGAPARWGLGTDYAHSEPLQAAAETGWVGLALWLAGLSAGLFLSMRRGGADPISQAAAVAACAMTAQLLVDNMLQIPGLALLFFSALAVAGARVEGRRWPRWAAVGGAALALCAWIPRTLAQDPIRAAVLFPKDAGAWEDLAYRASAQGRAGQAEALWAQAERAAPFNAVYPWRRAQLAGAQGNWDEARTQVERSIALEPGFLRARLLRAEALGRLGERAAARRETAELRRLLALPFVGQAENGYERVVSGFDEADRAALLRKK